MKDKIEKSLPVLAMLASAAALVAVFASSPSQTMSQAHASQLADLASRMERLETRFTRSSPLSRFQRDGDSSVAREEERAAGLDIRDIEARQTRLENQLKEYGIIERFEAHQRLVDESYRVALNPDQSPKERLEALNLLRDEGRVDEAVVNSMMDLWDLSVQDEKLGPYHRWALMEGLRGSNDPRFRDNVLSMLQEEPGAKMTGQAIATLEPMLPDPAVTEWLAHLSSNDPEPKIREHAASVLQSAGAPNK
ncbi:MAG: hypothetical protein HKN82_08230 [Akkermansiaceae bacterium]|nr:hypothetical protein [Akkermansiaceae bacterium]